MREVKDEGEDQQRRGEHAGRPGLEEAEPAASRGSICGTSLYGTMKSMKKKIYERKVSSFGEQ